MSTARPRVYLDFDGTLVPNRPRAGIDGWKPLPTDSSYDNGTAPEWYAPAMLARLTRLASRVDLVWLTTRGADANLLLEPCGFGPLPVIDIDEWANAPGPITDGWFKLRAVTAHLLANPTRAAVWVDDEIALRRGITFRVEEAAETVPALRALTLVAPRSDEGLSPTDVAAIETAAA